MVWMEMKEGGREYVQRGEMVESCGENREMGGLRVWREGGRKEGESEG